MAKARQLTYAILTFLATAAFLLPSPTTALVPYTTRPLWGLMFPSEYDPFKILEHSPLAVPRATEEGAVALARADWRETPAEHEISLDIPGMKKEDMKIEVEPDNRLLSVSGERKTEEEVKDEKWHRVERTVGKFWRQFRLPGNAEMENVSARLDNGVLKITVPKLKEEVKKKKEPKVISIAAEEKGKIGGSKQELWTTTTAPPSLRK